MNKMKNKQQFEAIVIGTGITGGWVTKGFSDGGNINLNRHVLAIFRAKLENLCLKQ